MSEPKSKVVLNNEDMQKPVTPSCIDGQSYEPSEVASETSTSRPQNTFKSAFFNFMRDFKRNHRNKDYQNVMRLGARRWRAMTQAQRAPYVLEAAKNRKSGNSKRRVCATEGSQSASKKRKRSKTDDNDSRASSRSRSRPPTGGSVKRCPTCGNRKKDKPKRKSKSRSPSLSSSASSKSSKT